MQLKKKCALTEEESKDKKKRGRSAEAGREARTKRARTEEGSGMSDGQFKELLERMDGLEDEVLGRLETLSKRLERFVGELTTHHKMVRTRRWSEWRRAWR